MVKEKLKISPADRQLLEDFIQTMIEVDKEHLDFVEEPLHEYLCRLKARVKSQNLSERFISGYETLLQLQEGKAS